MITLNFTLNTLYFLISNRKLNKKNTRDAQPNIQDTKPSYEKRDDDASITKEISQVDTPN